MARKSKDPRKPSQKFLQETGQAAQKTDTDETAVAAGRKVSADPEAELLRRAIKELGGDDEDFELLQGLSDDETDDIRPKAKKAEKGQTNEVGKVLIYYASNLTHTYPCSD